MSNDNKSTDVFADVRDKRMGDLTPEQNDRARELWVRTHRDFYNLDARLNFDAVLRVIDRLRSALAIKDAEIAQMYAAAGEAQAERDAARDERDTLVAEVARLREDAERYRWLRDSPGHARGAHPMDDHPPHCVFGKFDTDRHVNRAIYGEDLDKAVDAARKKG